MGGPNALLAPPNENLGGPVTLVSTGSGPHGTSIVQSTTVRASNAAYSDRGVKVELDIPYELWDSRTAEVVALERACSALVADAEELLESWFFERLPHLSTPALSTRAPDSPPDADSIVRDLNEHLCRRGALRGKYSSTLHLTRSCYSLPHIA